MPKTAGDDSGMETEDSDSEDDSEDEDSDGSKAPILQAYFI